MKFTVAICTWNRAALLSKVLAQLTRVQSPTDGWEVLVVNNNSTDDTESVLDNFAGRLPLRRACEPNQGLSHARNTALGQAKGEYIVWIDDDVFVDLDWLGAYARAIEQHPDAAFFGGPIRPRFEVQPPPWLIAGWSDVSAAYAARDLGDEAFEFNNRTELPYGANFVIRAKEQRAARYDPALGRRLTGGALGEETAVIHAILANGGTGWWVPSASVEHWISRERMTISYLRNYYRLQGATFHKWPGDARLVFGRRPVSLWARILRTEFAYAGARLTGDPHVWLPRLIEVSILRGTSCS
jgi:glycosyltransferase involved in cell wall biosynthesis